MDFNELDKAIEEITDSYKKNLEDARSIGMKIGSVSAILALTGEIEDALEAGNDIKPICERWRERAKNIKFR